MPRRKAITCFKNASRTCFYPKSTSSPVPPVSQASQVTEAPAQTSAPPAFAGCDMAACSDPVRRGQPRSGKKRRVSWQQVMQETGLRRTEATRTGSRHRRLPRRPIRAHRAGGCRMPLSWPNPSTHFKETDHLPDEPTRKGLGFFCFVFGLLFVFYFGCVSSRQKQPLIGAQHLRTRISCASRLPPLAPSLRTPATSCYAFAFLLVIEQLFLCSVNYFLALCQHPFSVDSPEGQLSATCSFPSFFVCNFHFNTNYQLHTKDTQPSVASPPWWLHTPLPDLSRAPKRKQ